ncbi:hypothetical protein MXB_1262 [Myxobolus squamalis]|nr:hypothetical protein MXB_1262 [Myxobolus squamalis]
MINDRLMSILPVVFLSNVVQKFKIFVTSIKTFTFNDLLNASHPPKLRSKINIPYVLKQLIIDTIPDDLDQKLTDAYSEITEFANKCFVMIFFEIRFHVAIYLQILFQISDPEPDFIHSNIFQLCKYIKEFTDIIPSQSLNKFCDIIYFKKQNRIVTSSFVLLFLDVEIIKSIVDNGPLFSFETYSIAINSVKSASLSTEQFNLKMKELKQRFPSEP